MDEVLVNIQESLNPDCGDLFELVSKAVSNADSQWLSVVKRDDGSLDVCNGEPESGNSSAFILNPNYGSSKDDTVNVAVKLEVNNRKDLSSFPIKGAFGNWSLLRIQNGQNKAYNALWLAVRKNDLNPNCNMFEASIHDLLRANLLDGGNVKSALDNLTSVFKYQIKKSNPKISDQTANNRADTYARFIAFNLKVDIVESIEIMNGPRDLSDTANFETQPADASAMQDSTKPASNSTNQSHSDAKTADASAMQDSTKPASDSTNRSHSDTKTADASNNNAGKRNKQGKSKTLGKRKKQSRGKNFANGQKHGKVKNSGKGNNTAKSKKLSAHKFKYATLNSFKTNKGKFDKVEEQLNKIIGEFRAKSDPEVINQFANASLKICYSSQVLTRERSKKPDAKSGDALSKNAGSSGKSAIASGDTSAEPAVALGDTSEHAAIDSPVVKGQAYAQSTESNNPTSAALNELELKITQMMENFRAQLKKALDEQASQAPLSENAQKAVNFIGKCLRTQIVYCAKFFCNFSYEHICQYLTEIKERFHYLKDIPSQTLQQIAKRLANALKRWKNGISKIPRFKNEHCKTLEQGFSMPFTNQQIKVDIEKGSISLPKGMPAIHVDAGKLQSNLIRLGFIKRDSNNALVKVKNFKGKLQNATLKLDGSRLFISLGYVIPKKAPVAPDNYSAVGIDRGVRISCAMSNGTFVSVYQKMQSLNDKIRYLQARLSNMVRNSNRYNKQKIILNRLYARKSNIMREVCRKVAQDLCRHNALIVFEALNVSGMSRSAKGTIDAPGKNVAQKSALNGGLRDNALYLQLHEVSYYAKQYKCIVMLVNPAYTSQTCPVCGHVAAKNRPNQSTFKCEKCGHEDNADLNAACNIRLKGIRVFPPQYQRIFNSCESKSMLTATLAYARDRSYLK